jgi:nitroimidazol reductase NimA-like FMN-containing flavoprotein (pyridoxamine 5'-phosphate oxidase superfamily)
MTGLDEPLLDGDEPRRPVAGEAGPDIRERIRRLVSEESYGVLCTQNQGQPYGSMIGFAFNDDLTTAVFATSRFTRKYELLCECNKVAIVINNREKFPDDLNKIEAITVTGSAAEINKDSAESRWVDLLNRRHPLLKSFITSPSTAVFCVKVVRYFHVHRFQEVREWAPDTAE